MLDMRVTTFVTGEAMIVRARGAADLVTEPVLQAALDRVLQEGPDSLVLDLSEVVFCDVRGLTTLLHGYTDATRRGVAFAMAGASPLLVRMWDALHPSDHKLHHATVADALRAVGHVRTAAEPPAPGGTRGHSPGRSTS